MARDGSWFDPHPVSVQELPAFPTQEFVEDFSAKQRTMCLAIYTAALVDVAQGRQHERHAYRPRNRRLPPTIASPGLCPDKAETNTPHPVGAEAGGDPKDRTGEVVGS